MRDDFEGLRMLCQATPWTLINSGEYLDAGGKRQLMLAGATDILNVHGQVTDVMRIGWLAAELGIPVSLGNTFLELGVHAACALPEVEWLEYSFQNFEHLVEQPMEIRDGWIYRTRPSRPRPGPVRERPARLGPPRCPHPRRARGRTARSTAQENIGREPPAHCASRRDHHAADPNVPLWWPLVSGPRLTC